MKLWIDAHLSPDLAAWITAAFGIEARAIREFGLRNAKDWEICEAAISAGAVVLTKDRDFVSRRALPGPKPQVLWVTCGNTSTAHLQRLLEKTLPQAVKLLEKGEPLVEISEPAAS